MTEKKKRGLLSWLGFADEEQSPKPKTEETVKEEAVEAPSEEQQTEEVAEQPQQTQELEQEPEKAEAAPAEAEAEAEELQVPVAPRIQEQEKPTESFFARLKRSLSRTKANIGAGFFGLFSGKKIDDDLFEELEEQLLIADVGMDTTTKIINNLTEKASRGDLKDGEALYGLLKEEMAEILSKVEQPLEIDSSKTPYVILMVGVNGVGKTTTIGKLAKQFQSQGKKVMLAAGDTFRAAAVEQLQVWGERNNVPVIAQHTGADSASVIYDAIEAAKARGVDVVIADTAGRLQNKANLMEELRKIVRVMKKIDDSAPHEIMLTLDAGTGQNAISQAKLFSDVAPLTGITLTKLDGTAKGGVIFAIADQFGIPIRYIGVGEGIEDLRPFETQEFIDALFSREE
ncbi:TPA: signal recognition particle-docking protein FtsY [Vibrio parahaemolyticus]